jgi:DNA-binding NarL/FixJ family response regulator
MENILFNNIVHIDKDVNAHEFFYDALQQVTSTSNYWTFTEAKDALYTLISKKITPDIIFLNLDFPKMSGQQFLARLNKFQHLSNVPVIIFSNATNRSTIQVTRILGAKGFITKSCSQREFIKILSSILSLEFLMSDKLNFSSFYNFTQRPDLQESISENVFWNEVVEFGFNVN